MAVLSRAKADLVVRAKMDAMGEVEEVRSEQERPGTGDENGSRKPLPELSPENITRSRLPETDADIDCRERIPILSAATGIQTPLPLPVADMPPPPQPVSENLYRDRLPKTAPGNGIRKPPPESLADAERLLPEKPLIRTKNQKQLFAFLSEHPNITTTYNGLSTLLGLKKNTVRDALGVFEKLGLLTKEAVLDPGNGMVLKIRMTSAKTPDRNSLPKQSTETVDQGPLMKIDRRENLSISQKRIEMTWPTLAAAGFGVHQLEQVEKALQELGKPTDKIVQSLDHAEWELENGRMVDKTGVPVADPCSWVFRSLARNGYYRKPSGYISSEEQALLDAEETAKSLLTTRQRVEKAQFEAWKAGLTAEEHEKAMIGYVGGPKEQWLKAYWLKTCRAFGISEAVAATQKG